MYIYICYYIYISNNSSLFMSYTCITTIISTQTFGQLSKYTSVMYSEMPEDEKKAWLERAEQDKARYLHELSEYVPPPGFDMKGDAISPHAEVPMVKAIKVRGKGARDPGAPKKSKSNGR